MEHSGPRRLWIYEDQTSTIQPRPPNITDDFPDSEIITLSGNEGIVIKDDDIDDEPLLLEIPVSPYSNYDSDTEDAPPQQFDFYMNIKLHSCDYNVTMDFTPLLLVYPDEEPPEQPHYPNFEDQDPDCLNESFIEMLPFFDQNRVTSTRNSFIEFNDQSFIIPYTLNNQPIIVPFILLDQDVEALIEFEDNLGTEISDQNLINDDINERMDPPDPSYWLDQAEGDIPFIGPEVWVVVDINEGETGIIIEEQNEQEDEGNENDVEDNDEVEENNSDAEMEEDYIEDDEILDDELVHEPVINVDTNDDVVYEDTVTEDNDVELLTDAEVWHLEYLELLAAILFEDGDEDISLSDESNDGENEEPAPPEPQPPEPNPRVIVIAQPQYPLPPGESIPLDFWSSNFN